MATRALSARTGCGPRAADHRPASPHATRILTLIRGARPLYERALAINEKALGPEHPRTARSLNNLGALLQDQSDLAAARSLYERAIEIGEKTLGAEHPGTAISLSNLARHRSEGARQ
jgi:tetratricopeptide (TPR) repeat protein